MKRIEKIYNYLNENCLNYKIDDIENMGITAQDIEDNLGILRNNASKELNELCRENRVIKIKCRPVKYFDRDVFENLFSVNIPKDIIEVNSLKDLIKKEAKKSPFDYLIGAETSLKIK